MKKAAVFFDRDNTLIHSDGYLGDVSAVRLIAGAADAIARVRQLGFAVVTVSNQSGVARGLFNEDAVVAVNQRTDELLRQDNPDAIIDRHEFCPFHPEAPLPQYRRDSDLRKPKAGMMQKAASEMELDLPRSWLIGDTPRDVKAGHAAGCRTILVIDPAVTPSPAASEPSHIEPDYTVANLGEAVAVIEAAARNAPAV